MIKKGYTAIPKSTRAIAWKDRRTNKNRVRITVGTTGVVTGVSRSRGSSWPRADIGGVVHTLHPWDWDFTPVRVGELRRWSDDRGDPFLVTKIGSLSSCDCLCDGIVFGTSCRYIEDNSEVISETR